MALAAQWLILFPVDLAIDPTRTADVAAVIMQEGELFCFHTSCL